jgi:hypothetical protein
VLVSDALLVERGAGDEDLPLLLQSDQQFKESSAQVRVGLVLGDLFGVGTRRNRRRLLLALTLYLLLALACRTRF